MAIARHGILICCTLLAACRTMADENNASAARLRVTASGGVLLDGRPFRGAGVNYFDAFSRRLKNPEDTSYRDGFARLTEYKTPFVRFMCGGFYAKDWERYLNDRDGYFAVLDDVVKSAAENGIGLIPSLFWWHPGVPDLVKEPLDQLGNPESKTIAFIRRYTEDVVKRYRDNPAIWAWEFGNEYNLSADIPGGINHLPPVVPSLGTPDTRTERDVVTTAMMLVAMNAFAETARRLDPYRPITSGHALPRPSQFHQRTEGAWTPDTAEEYGQELLFVHPAPFDLISIHIYPGKSPFFGLAACPYEKILAVVTDAANTAGKAVFAGEFGAGDTEKEAGPEAARSEFDSLLKAIENSKVALAALWVYDFSWQNDSYNITPENRRAYQLEALRGLNERLIATSGR